MVSVDEVFGGGVSVRISNDRFGDNKCENSGAVPVFQLGETMKKSHLLSSMHSGITWHLWTWAKESVRWGRSDEPGKIRMWTDLKATLFNESFFPLKFQSKHSGSTESAVFHWPHTLKSFKFYKPPSWKWKAIRTRCGRLALKFAIFSD